jgi:hypothetical protein
MGRFDSTNWHDPNLYLLFIGMSIIMIPLYKRDLLINKKSFYTILSISIISFFAAILIDQYELDKKYWGLLSLYFPIYIVLSYRIFTYIFVLIKKREPIDTAFDFKGITPWSDRIFNIFYFTQSVLVPFLLVILLRIKNK